MAYIFHTDSDPKQVDEFVIGSNQNTLFQCHEWAQVKEDTWSSVLTSVTEDGRIVASALVLIRPVVFGRTMFYIPRGPVLDWNNTEGTVTLSEGNILRIEYTPIIMTKGGGFTFD